MTDYTACSFALGHGTYCEGDARFPATHATLCPHFAGEVGDGAVTTIPLPWSRPPLTGNRTRGNVYARANEVKAAKGEAMLAIRSKGRFTPMVGAEVTLHFRPKDKRRRDADGLAPTLKVCLDALVAAGVLPDDSWVHVPAATCRIHPPNGEPAAMWLELEEVA